MEKMKQLMDRKKEMEDEIKSLLDVLESQGGVGMTAPLVDAEGFPRRWVQGAKGACAHCG
jgi:peptide deformylase